MIGSVLRTLIYSGVAGYATQQALSAIKSEYLLGFLEGNLINLLIALMAINTATMGIVLTKIRELLDKQDNQSAFDSTKASMLLSIKEQISLIVLSAVVLSVKKSTLFSGADWAAPTYSTLLYTIFAFSMFNLYDTSKSVLIIIDFKNKP